LDLTLSATKTLSERDFDGYIDNLLAPEKRATSPSSSDIINGFSLEDDNDNRCNSLLQHGS
jgi:hypothetical protein